MNQITIATVELDLDAAEVARARRFVAETLAEWGLGALVPDATLLASETVTNAVTYGVRPVHLCVGLQNRSVRISVRDGGEPLSAADRAMPEASARHGRGIAIVGALANQYGVTELEEGGKLVWFDLALGDVDATRPT